jgi:hypothetical protein
LSTWLLWLEKHGQAHASASRLHKILNCPVQKGSGYVALPSSRSSSPSRFSFLSISPLPPSFPSTPPQLPRHRPPPPLSRSRRLGTDPRGLPYTPPSQLEKAGGGIGGPALPGPLPSGRVAIPAVGCGGARRDVRIGAWT